MTTKNHPVTDDHYEDSSRHRRSPQRIVLSTAITTKNHPVFDDHHKDPSCLRRSSQRTILSSTTQGLVSCLLGTTPRRNPRVVRNEVGLERNEVRLDKAALPTAVI